MEGRWKNAALYVNQSTVDLDDTGPQSLARYQSKAPIRDWRTVESPARKCFRVNPVLDIDPKLHPRNNWPPMGPCGGVETSSQRLHDPRRLRLAGRPPQARKETRCISFKLYPAAT